MMPMNDVHPRVASALTAQLARWRTTLDDGERRIGWKLGLNLPEIEAVIGSDPIIGHLTTRTLLGTGDRYAPPAQASLRAETEVALVIGDDVSADADPEQLRDAIAGAAVAIEIVDVSRPSDNLEGIVIANVFHRAFVIAPAQRVDLTRVEGYLSVNGTYRASALVRDDHTGVVRDVAQLLEAVGERLQRGDHVLAGALTHVPIEPGDEIEAGISALGTLKLTIAGTDAPRVR
jgi:2-keto-4-pentenoate hydratase